jgi:alkylation response protein AidB-like acyl-CoA dehydrogenase
MSDDRSRKQHPTFPHSVRGLNFFDTDANLHLFLERAAPGLLERRSAVLGRLGAFAGDRLDRQAEQSDQDFPPSLKDLPDNRTGPTGRRNEIRLNREYEECQQELYKSGIVAVCFDKSAPESHILPFVSMYLVAQSDIATGCPFAMTHPTAYVLDRLAPQAVKDKYLPEILRTDGKTAICGTWATERHSGSDIGGTVTTAVRLADGSYRLQGHNWFTSAFGFKKFMGIKTARVAGAPAGGKGLGLYLVPSHIDDDWVVGNNFDITHLKRKLGTRGLPTVEVDLQGALAYEIVPVGQGLKAMMMALGCSRAHNAMGAAGVMRRAYMESLCWAGNRETFGKTLIERPMVQKRILDIAVQWMAGSALAFEAARSFDDASKDSRKEPWMRIVTALAKFRTAEQAVWCAQKALELVGGNGYTEDYATARQFRDAMVLPVWEGPEQIQALELMRMIAGAEPGDRLFLEKIASARDTLPATMNGEKINLLALAGMLDDSFKKLRAEPQKAELVADEFLHKMSDILTYALLCEEAAWTLANKRDGTKLLVCRAYHSCVWPGELAAPSFSPGALLRHFIHIVQAEPIPHAPDSN